QSVLSCSIKLTLGRHSRLLARVRHHFVWLALRRWASAVVLADKHDLKAALGQHSRERSFALADSQCLPRVVPVKWDRGVHSLLVVIAVVFVFIEREVSIRSAIDAQLDGIFRLFAGPFLVRPHRHDGTPRTNRGSLSMGAAASLVRGPSRELPLQKSYHFAFGR